MTRNEEKDIIYSWNCYGNSCSLDKESLIDSYIRYMFSRTSEMFKYNNLPDTIVSRDLEYLLQSVGFACGFINDGKPYILKCALSGIPNESLLPTKLLVTNPYLNISKQFTINKDCVWFRNDSMWQGLYPLNSKYASLLAEVDISMKYSAINSRILSLISASDERTKNSAELILKKVYEGKDLGVIAESPILESLKSYPYGGTTNNYITSLLELRQYIQADWYISLGINSNYNMKRETLSTSEVGVNEKTLYPLIENMLDERKKSLSKFNSMFGTNINVEFNSSWKYINEENKLEFDVMRKEVKDTNYDSK